MQSIDLVHIHDNRLSGKTNAGITNKIDELSKNNFLEGVEISNHIFFDIDIRKMLKEDAVTNPDLVVMGTHGTTNWKEDALGSNAAKVILSSQVPVLVTKSSQKIKLDNVVFASSFSQQTDDSFKAIKYFIQNADTTLHLLFVIIPSFFETTHSAESKMKAFAERAGIKNFTINIYNDRTIEDGIHNFSNKINADLISMETHGRSGLAHFFSGSITEDVVNHAKLPVLSTRVTL